MKSVLMSAAVVAAMAVGAAPVVTESSVTMTQDLSGNVTINYEIANEPAIVTVDIQTNGVSIGGENLWYFAGDVNKLVGTGPHTMTWRPTKAWPGQKIPSGVRAVVTAWATNAPPDYFVTSLTAKNTRLFYANAESIPGGIQNELYKTEMLVLRKIPAAHVTYRMGQVPGEDSSTACPAHLVTLKDDFYIGVYQVTQRQYELITGTNTAAFCRADCYRARPVETLKYTDVRGATSGHNWPDDGHAVDGKSFLGLLRAHTGVNHFDLPGEARWEYACRAGSGDMAYGVLNSIARHKGNAGSSSDPDNMKGTNVVTAIVGSYEANGFGLYDMLGNVWEFCLDWYGTGADLLAVTDPEKGRTMTAGNRVVRGGSFLNEANLCRAAARHYRSPTDPGHNGFGFRVACEAGFAQ